MKCTWKDCLADASNNQYNSNGQVWASLCDDHAKRLDECLEKGTAKEILRDWVLANGGASKLAEKM
jgi:hypothetical protein